MLRSRRELRRARRAGRRDGKAGIPAPDDDAIPFAPREIMSRAEEQVHAAVERWRREDRALAVQLADLEPGIEEAAARVAAAEQRLETETADHERRVTEEDARLSRLQASLEELPAADAPEVRFEQPGSEDEEDPETEPGSSSSGLAQIGGGSAAVDPVALERPRRRLFRAGRGAPSVTVVLFDVSNSTGIASVRARYETTFALVLDRLREESGVLGADVIDANPLVHGRLLIAEVFDPCTITDNALACRSELEERAARARERTDEILQRASHGTDIFGALAAQFFAAYPGSSDRTLVLLSDMVQSANGLHFGVPEAWPGALVAEMLSRVPRVDLSGVRVYVVGAGATTLRDTTPAQVEGIERFWRAWFERMGARVVFYGANLPRFPVAEVVTPTGVAGTGTSLAPGMVSGG